ncbi:MAG TPA: DUF485 domain-containing protein [Hyphomicrobiaceae bacterium]|nr:DUF485 domain-containing protein [Hyphomicrobiaceae bacterium]
MSPEEMQRIRSHPAYEELVRKRTSFGIVLTIIMLVIYFGFVLLIAFDKSLLATPIGAGVTTVGIPLGVFVIVSAFVLTGIYVRRANSEFDALTRQISEDL